MASYNKVIMMGNLTRDPELSFLPSQTAVAEFGLATTHKYRGADGSNKEDTCFIDCRIYGKRAEVIGKYFKKGSPILIEGRLTLDRWEAPDGAKRSKHRIFVENFEFAGGGQGGGGAGAAGPRSSMDAQAPGGGFGDEPGPGADDIPF